MKCGDIVIVEGLDIIAQVVCEWSNGTVTIVCDAEWPITLTVPIDDVSVVSADPREPLAAEMN